jgi:2-phosphosulfolactate phosphatase
VVDGDPHSAALASDAGPGRFDPWPPAPVHVEWGLASAALAAERGDVVCVVDVLSFSTTVVLALARGATVIVIPEPELERIGREEVGRRLDAHVVARHRAGAGARYTLSPVTTATARAGDRIVVTSLNGARIVAAAAGAPALIVGGLINAAAAATALQAAMAEHGARRVTIVACGERWATVADDDGLRPATEDWLGAGAIVAALTAHGYECSPEASAASASFMAARAELPDVLRRCVSGRELVEKGFAADVDLAAELNSVSVAGRRVSAQVLGLPGAVLAPESVG